MKTYASLILTIFILVQGFLISRSFVYLSLVDYISFYIIKKTKGQVKNIVLGIFTLSILISLIVPNILTILTMIPILKILQNKIDQASIHNPKEKKRWLGLLLFVAMFGANLGGIGSITGSPLNLLVVGFITLNHIPHYELVNFFTWLIVGLPLVFFIFWIVVFIVYYQHLKSPAPFIEYKNIENILLNKNHKIVVIFTIFSICFWFFSSFILTFETQRYTFFILAFMFIYTVFLLSFFFLIPFSQQSNNSSKSPLIPFSILFSNLPTNGVIIISLSIFISYLLSFFQVDHWILSHFQFLSQVMTTHIFISLILLTSIAIFMSEFFSNTASTIALFNIVISVSSPDILVPFLISISLAACVPSMMPTATTVNSFAIGSLPKFFHPGLIRLGFLMNLTVIVIISSYIAGVIVPLFKNL